MGPDWTLPTSSGLKAKSCTGLWHKFHPDDTQKHAPDCGGSKEKSETTNSTSESDPTNSTSESSGPGSNGTNTSSRNKLEYE